MPDEPNLAKQILDRVAVGHDEQPLGEFLGAGPAADLNKQRAGPDEHVLEILADHAKLVDRPQKPCQPRRRLERCHAERPLLGRLETEPRGQGLAVEPHNAGGRAPGRHDGDSRGRDSGRSAERGDAGRRRHERVEPPDRLPLREATGPQAQPADRAAAGHEPAGPCHGRKLRAAEADDRSRPEAHGEPRQSGSRAEVDDRPAADLMHHITRPDQAVRQTAASRCHRHDHVMARGGECGGREFDLPAGADRIEPADDEQGRATHVHQHPGRR